MKQLMEYHIISGRVREIRQVAMSVFRQNDRPVRRGTRAKGTSTLKKILANEREAVARLARILNCNFAPGDLWLTLRYSDKRLPETKDEAKRLAANFLRRCARQFEKATGEKLRYVIVTSDHSPKRGERARLHHHVVMDRLAWEYITKNWPADEVSYTILDGRRDYTGIARYMIQNADGGNNKKRWSCSHGLRQPIYTVPVPVEELKIRPPKGADIREKKELYDPETGVGSAYLRCVMPEKARRR